MSAMLIPWMECPVWCRIRKCSVGWVVALEWVPYMEYAEMPTKGNKKVGDNETQIKKRLRKESNEK